jgi:hypothetical protein
VKLDSRRWLQEILDRLSFVGRDLVEEDVDRFAEADPRIELAGGRQPTRRLVWRAAVLPLTPGVRRHIKERVR